MARTHKSAEPWPIATLNSFPEAVLTIDLTSRVTFMNPAAETLLDCKQAAAVGKKLAEILPNPDGNNHGPAGEQTAPAGERVLGQGESSYSMLLVRSGKTQPIAVNSAPICTERGQRFGTVLVIRDLAARKHAEAELRSSLDEAVQAGRIKSEILTKMSHAVRTPMNGIIGLMELVLDTELSQEQREFLQIARSSARSLLTVINDVLDLTNLEAGKLTLEASDFSLRHSLGDLLRALAVRAQEKGLDLAFRVSPDVPDGLVGDPARLRQVIINLVDNAIKFTERGEIVVDVSMSAGQGPSPVEVELQFSVADTGIGIPANKRDTIFEPFVQGSTSVTRKYGGTGLGLTISANLVEKMGGRIWVNSEVGKGSTFYFTAPLRVSSDPAANALPPGLPRLWGLPALVVDSHATSRRIVEEMLLQWHMKPQTVGDTQTALALVEEAAAKGEPFPLVLVDGHNLDVDSFLLAQQFHRRQELVGATIMMLLPRSRSAATTLCREVGIAATVTKPIKQSDLLDAIVRALRISFQDNRWRAGGSVTGLFLPGRPLRVLLVEDNDVNQKLAIRILKKQGHTVVPAVHGKEALSLLDHQAFDLVLMDLQMPEMDGIEATTQIRAREEGTGRHIPIIALTAHAMHGDRERCLAAGMDGYISKPVRPDEIAKAIEAVLGSGAAPAPTVASELAETQKVQP